MKRCRRCGSENLDYSLADAVGPLIQCRNCGRIHDPEEELERALGDL